MRVRLIRVPYDAGNRGLRMGAGLSGNCGSAIGALAAAGTGTAISIRPSGPPCRVPA